MMANREQHSRFVHTSIIGLGSECAQKIDTMLFGDQPGAFKTHDVMMALDELLQKRVDKMVTSNRKLETERKDDQLHRDRRDELKKELFQEIVAVKTVMEMMYGKKKADEYGLSGETPTNADMIANYALNTAHILEMKPDLGSVSAKFQPLNVQEIIDSFRSLSSQLKDALEKVKLEGREALKAQEQREWDIEEWMRAYSAVAQIISSLFYLAGHDTLAERVRPTSRKVSGEQDAEEEPIETAPTPQTNIGTQTGMSVTGDDA